MRSRSEKMKPLEISFDENGDLTSAAYDVKVIRNKEPVLLE